MPRGTTHDQAPAPSLPPEPAGAPPADDPPGSDAATQALPAGVGAEASAAPQQSEVAAAEATVDALLGAEGVAADVEAGVAVPGAGMLDPRTAAHARRLLHHVLGGPTRYTREEIAERAGVSVEQAGQLWRAIGFADVGHGRAFTDADAAALSRITELVTEGIIDWDTAVDVARSLGQTTARLADWQVDTFTRLMVEAALVDPVRGVTPQALAAVDDEVRLLVPALERLLRYVWRRQLAATVGRTLAAAAAEQQGVDQAMATVTVGFADLVGFTRLSRRLERDQLTELVRGFETQSADVVTGTGARLVKTLGDEVMFVAAVPSQAAATALELHRTRRDADAVPLRIGMATGPVLGVMGDLYGPTVNLASRLTDIARPRATLVDERTADALGRGRRFGVRAVRPRPVRGFGILRTWSVSEPPAGG